MKPEAMPSSVAFKELKGLKPTFSSWAKRQKRVY